MEIKGSPEFDKFRACFVTLTKEDDQGQYANQAKNPNLMVHCRVHPYSMQAKRHEKKRGSPAILTCVRVLYVIERVCVIACTHTRPTPKSQGNGHISIAEFDAWVQKSLLAFESTTLEEADGLWQTFRPCYKIAHADAADIMTEHRVAGVSSS